MDLSSLFTLGKVSGVTVNRAVQLKESPHGLDTLIGEQQR